MAIVFWTLVGAMLALLIAIVAIIEHSLGNPLARQPADPRDTTLPNQY